MVRKAYLASVVPVIVNAILNEHQLIVDIVAFVAKGDFPRSRLGEKQRGKILASWVTRKMRTIAQFGIRDPDGADSQITEVPEGRMSTAHSSIRAGSMVGGAGAGEPRGLQITQAQPRLEQDYAPIPTGISEMPANYASSIVESPPLPHEDEDFLRDENNETPTGLHRNNQFSFQEPYLASTIDAPLDASSSGYYQHEPSSESTIETPQDYHEILTVPSYENHYGNIKDQPLPALPPHPRYDSKPTLSLPSVTGRESLVSDSSLDFGGSGSGAHDSWTLPPNHQQDPSSQPSPSYHHEPTSSSGGQDTGGAGGGGRRLRVANAGSDDDDDEKDGDWPQEAIMHMNLGNGASSRSRGDTTSSSGSQRQQSARRYDGSGYGYGHAV